MSELIPSRAGSLLLRAGAAAVVLVGAWLFWRWLHGH